MEEIRRFYYYCIINHRLPKDLTCMTFETYLETIADDRKEAMKKLRQTIVKNLPKGFQETFSNFGIGYCVPFSIYPEGYHCDPTTPLPFMSIASQKNFIALYHMGIYGDKKLSDWFIKEYPKHNKTKLDMGKSCIRFKKIDQIPFALIAELTQKISVDDWITNYEKNLKRK